MSTRQRRTYLPRIVGDKVMMPAARRGRKRMARAGSQAAAEQAARL